jgi:hypothetical protein
VQDARGIADFHALRRELARKRSGDLAYYAFDLLFLDGKDRRQEPLIRRRGSRSDAPRAAASRSSPSSKNSARGRAGCLVLYRQVGRRAPLYAGKVQPALRTKKYHLVFDLDPDDGIGWAFVVETALRLRAVLEA